MLDIISLFLLNKINNWKRVNMKYLYLLFAIFFEVIATTVLKSSQGFTVFIPTVISLLLYGISFYFLSMCMQYFPTGVVYAVWSGVGIVLISLFAFLFYKQSLDLPAIFGILMIICGVLIMRLFSKSF